MDKYINATKLIADIESRFCEGCDPGSGNMLCRNCRASLTIGELEGAPAIDIEQVICYNRECNVAIQHDWVPYNTDNTTYITYKCKRCGDIKTVK